jgi:dephospho-CoA kinase
VEAVREEGAVLAVAEVPLLFEVGLEAEFDSSVLVAATRDVCLDRLSDARGLSREESLKIWSTQMEPTEKEGRADYVIHNNGTLADLRDRALALLDLLRARARSTGGV